MQLQPLLGASNLFIFYSVMVFPYFILSIFLYVCVWHYHEIMHFLPYFFGGFLSLGLIPAGYEFIGLLDPGPGFKFFESGFDSTNYRHNDHDSG